jgi:hypothetical protein
MKLGKVSISVASSNFSTFTGFFNQLKRNHLASQQHSKAFVLNHGAGLQ